MQCVSVGLSHCSGRKLSHSMIIIRVLLASRETSHSSSSSSSLQKKQARKQRVKQGVPELGKRRLG